MNIDKLKPRPSVLYRPDKPMTVSEIVGAVIMGIVLVVALYFLSSTTSTAPPPVQATENAPYLNLDHYDIWTVPDTVYFCAPHSYSDIPPGTLILTPRKLDPPKQTSF